MLSVLADSITAAGDRLTTVITDEVEPGRLAGIPALAVAWPAGIGRPLLVTGGADLADILGGDPGARLRAAAAAPRLVGLGVHAPCVTVAERAGLDPSMQAVLAVARVTALPGGVAGYGEAAEIYLRILLGPTDGREAMDHVAAPAALIGELHDGPVLPAGRFTGWLTWAEILIWRGQPC